MGAWEFIRPHLTEVAGGRPVRRVGAAAERKPGGRIGSAPCRESAGADQPGVRRQARRTLDGATARKALHDSTLTSVKD